MKQNELIRSLIKDDLINSRLVSGLNDLGLDSGKYYLHLSETIFSLLGLKDIENGAEIWEEYFFLVEKASKIDIAGNPEQLDNLAEDIYSTLEKLSNNKGNLA
jgi:hypothetical protein